MTLADFCDLGLYTCKNCLVRRCDLSWGANTGLHLDSTTDCTVEDCTLTFNNYRQYGGGWHDGGMKNIFDQSAHHDSPLRGGVQLFRRHLA